MIVQSSPTSPRTGSGTMAMETDERPADVERVADWDRQAKLLRAIAHPVRLTILEMLCERPHCVKHLNSLIPIAQPQLSQHMAALRKAELVACHACGPVRCYYIFRPTLVKKLIRLLGGEHSTKARDCDSIIREARQGWEQLEDCGQHE